MLPAYARELVEAAENGQVPAGLILITTHWNTAKWWRAMDAPVLVAPALVDDFIRYDFSVVRGLHVIVTAPRDQLRALTDAVEIAKPLWMASVEQ